MPKFHHANLGVRPEDADAEADFLIGVLGYVRLEPPPIALKYGARWFGASDGTQVHLSVDAGHTPAAQAHTAIDVSAELSGLEERLTAAGVPFTSGEFNGQLLVTCKDPAGNGWELRG